VALTGKEFELLLLIRQPQQVHSRSAILAAVWGAHWVGDDSVLGVYVLIQTVRGVGFMLKECPAKPT
jgi:DNA-binding response OmpR family regulator